jgi:hypothetical protein
VVARVDTGFFLTMFNHAYPLTGYAVSFREFVWALEHSMLDSGQTKKACLLRSLLSPLAARY